MDKKNLMPQQAQPIERITTGQLPDVLAELSEEVLGGSTFSSASVQPLGHYPFPPNSPCYIDDCGTCLCSYDGDDAE